MAKINKNEKIEVETIGEHVESPQKEAFRELIEGYKKQNPEKYVFKKTELERKLNEIE